MWTRWGTYQNFFLAFLDELEKQIFTKKTVEKKKTNLKLFKKIKKNRWIYHYRNLNYMIHSSWDIEQNWLKLVILGHFLPIPPKNPPKNEILKKCRKLLEILLFYTCVPNHNHMMYGSWQKTCKPLLGT